MNPNGSRWPGGSIANIPLSTGGGRVRNRIRQPNSHGPIGSSGSKTLHPGRLRGTAALSPDAHFISPHSLTDSLPIAVRRSGVCLRPSCCEPQATARGLRRNNNSRLDVDRCALAKRQRHWSPDANQSHLAGSYGKQGPTPKNRVASRLGDALTVPDAVSGARASCHRARFSPPIPYLSSNKILERLTANLPPIQVEMQILWASSSLQS